jgi:hypothetical protein
MPAVDTSPEIRRRIDAAYRRMSPAQKVARIAGLTQLAYSLAIERLRSSHPGESERQLRIRLSARWLSQAQLIAAFGWDPRSPAAPP